MYVDLLKNVFSGSNAADRETTRQTIKQETEKIGTSLARAFYQTDNESKQRAFVHNLHAGLVRLSDYFCETVRKKDEEPPPEIFLFLFRNISVREGRKIFRPKV